MALYKSINGVVFSIILLFAVVESKQKNSKEDDRDSSNDRLVTKKAWFEVELDDEPLGKVVIGLFGDTCPITVNNFAALAKGNWKNNERLGYENTIVHRVIPDLLVQGGDVTVGDGTGGVSIYGAHFDDENHYVEHKRGTVSMANTGPDSNSSQFFILLNKARWLNKKHVAFGQVIEGMEIIDKIGEVKTNDNAVPLKIVRISESGVEHVKEPFIPEELL